MRLPHSFFKKLLGTIMFLCTFSLLLLGSIILNATSISFYEKSYDRFQLQSSVNMSKTDYVNATKDLIQYSSGKRAEITATATINGVEKQVFNQKEKQHMVDVKLLLNGAQRIAVILLTILFGILLFVYVYYRKEVFDILQTYRYALFAFLAFFALITTLMITNFDTFWTGFHQLFFTNDLWLLDPSVDRMILMYPLQLFQSLVFNIVGWFVLGMFLVGVFVALAKKKAL